MSACPRGICRDRFAAPFARDEMRPYWGGLVGSMQMADLAVTDALFFERTGMDPARIDALVSQSLSGMADGELYLEYSQSECLALDDGRIKSAAFDTTQGFGLRAVAD